MCAVAVYSCSHYCLLAIISLVCSLVSCGLDGLQGFLAFCDVGLLRHRWLGVEDDIAWSLGLVRSLVLLVP